MSRENSERGSATVVVAGLLVFASVIGIAVMVIAVARAARHQADAAADFAALAGAVALLEGSADPCQQAAHIATTNGAGVDECIVEGQTVRVTVSVAVRLGRWGVGHAKAEARAGPVEATDAASPP